MGHSLEVHLRSYPWASAAGTEDAFQRPPGSCCHDNATGLNLRSAEALALFILRKDSGHLAFDLWEELIGHPYFLQIDLVVGMDQNVAHSCHGTPG